MKIKHMKVSCGPDGSFQPGAERDTDNPADNLSLVSAQQLVAGGYADDITPLATTPSVAAAAEAAAAEAAAAEAAAAEAAAAKPAKSRK